MFRRMIPLAVAIVLVLGCGKKDGGGGGGGGPDPNTPIPGMGGAEPGGVYMIKIRAEQAGDKTEEVEHQTGGGEVTFGGKTEKEKEEQKLEFTEHIIDMPAGATKPNKLTRAYKVAQKYDKKSGALKALAFEGKTVTIEKKGPSYEFTADGKKLTIVEASDLYQEFSKKEGRKIDELLPKGAVKVGESWTVEPAAIKALGGDIPFPIDETKSKITGKLTRAYTKDGKQWGVLTLDCDLVLAPGAGGKGPSMNGTIKLVATIDTVIDGSSREGTSTMNIKMDVGAKGTKEGDVKITGDMVQTKTVKNAK